MYHIVALSGGKDSTALALRLKEVEPREYIYLCTPTGNELPSMEAHWDALEKLLGIQITRLTNHDLLFWIHHFQALPNWRQRWCTRLLKIEPCLFYVQQHQPATLYVGLRADEEERKGIYSGDALTRFPLREWGWDLQAVHHYLQEKGVTIPARTDCAWCYGQRLQEWKQLWLHFPEKYAEAEALEGQLGVTFRSPGRDTWPASLSQLRLEFAAGRKVRGEATAPTPCRVCTL